MAANRAQVARLDAPEEFHYPRAAPAKNPW
jgi:hypothetical protein